MTEELTSKPLKEDEVRALARRMATHLNAHDVLLLRGDLGAGKTTFARALLEGLGHEGQAPSPTFTLAQSYDKLRVPVVHFDLYRLKTPQEIEEIGFDEACAGGLVLVEWPEKAQAYMPRHAMTLFFDHLPDGQRRLRLHADAAQREKLKGLFHGEP